MTLEYFDAWDPNDLEFGKAIDAAEAKKRYESGKTFAAKLGEGTDYRAIAFFPNLIAVYFCEGDDLIEMEMVFDKRPGGKLFLQHVKFYEEENDGAEVTTRFSFRENGTVHMLRSNHSTGDEEAREAKIDVSKIVIALPKFGEFDELVRRERAEIG